MNSLKKIAAALITNLALAGIAHTADLPVATDRLPDELLERISAELNRDSPAGLDS